MTTSRIPYYKVIQAPYIFDLEVEVNDAIKMHWTPLGGITYVPGQLFPFMQAMICPSALNPDEDATSGEST